MDKGNCDICDSRGKFFYNNEEFNIDEYKSQLDFYKDKKIFCKNGHELVYVNSKRIKPHLRHFITNINNHMTDWHKIWQSYFDRIEIPYENHRQISRRFSDADLDDKVIEFQHSRISEEEVNNRKNDYTIVNNKPIFWVIDGEDSINVEYFKNNRVFLEFLGEFWKYKSFIDYDFIFIDIKGEIFKINPKKIKCNMIDVENPKSKEDFIKYLHDNNNIWNDIEPDQCTLFIEQKGAGNGKTYGIINMIENCDYQHYDVFIYLTKAHTAKYTIYKELEGQVEEPDPYKKGGFKEIHEMDVENENEKYVAVYKKKNGKKVHIYIATIDSFFYCIGDKNNKSFYYKFLGIAESIINQYIETTKNGSVNFANKTLKLNKRVLLVIDESQVLSDVYAKAIIEIMKTSYIDCFISQDLLQSTACEDNIASYFKDNYEFPYILIKKTKPSNRCRRFNNPYLIKFVNHMIDFEKYKLPKIDPYKIEVEDRKALTFYLIPDLKYGENIAKILNDITEIHMKEYIRLVDKYDSEPEDFGLIVSFTKQNPIAESLTGMINNFWNERKNNDKTYESYAIFHKSEEGSSINLEESKHATRIYSIQASQGDGRKHVMIIQLSEKFLKKFCKNNKSTIVYDSLEHVAFTRMVQTLSISYTHDYKDKITKKIQEFVIEEKIPNTGIEPVALKEISKKIDYNNLIMKNSNLDFDFDLLYDKIIQKSSLLKNLETDDDNETKDDRILVDYGNHIIRYASLVITIYTYIVNLDKGSYKKAQIKQKFLEISKSGVEESNSWKEYTNSISDKKIALLHITKGGDYDKYYNIIYENMKNIIEKINEFTKNGRGNDISLCPYECIILSHMLDITQNGNYSNTSVTDIYNVTDIYMKSYIKNGFKDHDSCLCDRHFVCNIKNEGDKLESIRKYLCEFFNLTQIIKESMSVLYEKFPSIDWNIHFSFPYDYNSNCLEIYKRFQLIGYDKENVIIAYIKPNFNDLNRNEILLQSIYDSYFIQNMNMDECNDDIKNKNFNINDKIKKVKGKKITTCVLSLGSKTPYFINWDDDEGLDLIEKNKKIIKENIKKYLHEHYSSENNKVRYFYEYYFKKYYKRSTDFLEFLNKQKTSIQVNYISEFFSNMITEVEECCDPDDEIIESKYSSVFEKYYDEKHFNTKLNSRMNSFFKIFF